MHWLYLTLMFLASIPNIKNADQNEILKYSIPFKQKIYTFTLTDGSFNENPAWNGKSKIPLSNTDACTIGQKAINDIWKVKGWNETRCELRKYGSNKHWIYILQFEPDYKKNETMGIIIPLQVLVLLNGNYVHPKITNGSPNYEFQ